MPPAEAPMATIVVSFSRASSEVSSVFATSGCVFVAHSFGAHEFHSAFGANRAGLQENDESTPKSRRYSGR